MTFSHTDMHTGPAVDAYSAADRLCMEDVVALKNLPAMLQFAADLASHIKS